MDSQLRYRNTDGVWISCETVADYRGYYYMHVTRDFNEYMKNASVEVTVNNETFSMQIKPTDIESLNIAVTQAKADGVTALDYITDIGNVRHENISVTDAETVLSAMRSAYLTAYKQKQSCRAALDAAEDIETMKSIQFSEGVQQ